MNTETNNQLSYLLIIWRSLQRSVEYLTTVNKSDVVNRNLPIANCIMGNRKSPNGESGVLEGGGAT